MNNKIKIPQKVMRICELLEHNGFSAYIVGGCVRDAILGNTPHDYDICTNATQEQTQKIFDKKEDSFVMDITGAIEHGVTFVMFQGEQFEIATFRKDKEYVDGRHCTVEIGVPIEEDLKRRDFTVNAMAYRPTTQEFVDLFNGISDCDKKIIRAVGNAYDRFNEDALRIMRAFRFQSQLGFTIDNDIINVSKELKDNIVLASYERISKEFTKLICGDGFQDALLNLYNTGLLDIIMPEFRTIMECRQNNPHHDSTVGGHTIKVMQNVDNSDIMRYAALFHDFGKPSTKVTDDDGIDHFPEHPKKSLEIAIEIMKRFRFNNDFINKVSTLVSYHDAKFLTQKSIRRFISKYGRELLLKEIELRKADVLGQNPNFQFNEKLQEVEDARLLIEKTLDELDNNIGTINMKDLAITGKDLIAMGYKQGPIIGEILGKMFDLVLEDPSKNTKDELLKIL